MYDERLQVLLRAPLLGDEKPTGGHKQDAKKLTMIPWAQGPKKIKISPNRNSGGLEDRHIP